MPERSVNHPAMGPRHGGRPFAPWDSPLRRPCTCSAGLLIGVAETLHKTAEATHGDQIAVSGQDRDEKALLQVGPIAMDEGRIGS